MTQVATCLTVKPVFFGQDRGHVLDGILLRAASGCLRLWWQRNVMHRVPEAVQS